MHNIDDYINKEIDDNFPLDDDIDKFIEIIDKQRKVLGKCIDAPTMPKFRTFTNSEDERPVQSKREAELEEMLRESIINDPDYFKKLSVEIARRKEEEKRKKEERIDEEKRRFSTNEELIDDDDPFKDMFHFFESDKPKEEKREYETRLYSGDDVFSHIFSDIDNAGKSTALSKVDNSSREEKKESRKIRDAFDSYVHTSNRKEELRRAKIVRCADAIFGKFQDVIDFLSDKIFEPISDFFRDAEPKEVIFATAGIIIIIGTCVVTTLDKSLQENQGRIAPSPTPSPTPKHTHTITMNNLNTPTTFVQREDGSVTNTFDEEVYQKFEDYARENNLIMNSENFEKFCDMFYSDTNNRSSRR